MPEFEVGDLEKELGCFDPPLQDVSHRKDHESSNAFFDPSPEFLSRSSAPSKTKSIYPFGIDGSMGWVSAAGELLQVASCVEDRLIGVEYKRGIERGQDYYLRGKMLDQAINSAHGYGYGIGLSLKIKAGLEPMEVFWVSNRWPRFSYQHEGLEIKLQYYVQNRSVIQQYQVRNTTGEEKRMPYTVSSDVCFREHGLKKPTFYPIPTTTSLDRLLMLQNSEILVKCIALKVETTMAVFLNTHRQSIWTGDRPTREDDTRSDDEDRDAEHYSDQIRDQVRETMSAGKFLSESGENHNRFLFDKFFAKGPRRVTRINFAECEKEIVIPGNSTQELCMVIRTSRLSHVFDDPAHHTKHLENAQRDENTSPERAPDEPGESAIPQKIRREQAEIAKEIQNLPFNLSDSSTKAQIARFVDKRLKFGRAYAMIDWTGEARYEFYMASLIAENVYREGSFPLSNAQFEYAKFLFDSGWRDLALKVMERLLRILSTRRVRDRNSTTLWWKVQCRLVSMQVGEGRFSDAENICKQALKSLNSMDTRPNRLSCFSIEKTAWAQANMGEYERAHTTYSRLLQQNLESARIILSNLGFTKRKLDQFQEAEIYYERALNKPPAIGGDELSVRNGLYICLRRRNAAPERIEEIAASSIQYINVNFSLPATKVFKPPFINGPFSFALARHLESLLSMCTITVKGDETGPGIMFLDADPLSCLGEGRYVYFQFRFLMQCQKYLDTACNGRDSVLELVNRIRAACKGHLIWAFKVAKYTETWRRYDGVGSAFTDTDSEDSFEKSSLSRCLQGAYNLLKLDLYFSTYGEQYELILELLDSKMDEWLSYVVHTRHMENLWVERETTEILEPPHNASRDGGSIEKSCPQYHLSDFTLLWMALYRLEMLLQSIENVMNCRNDVRGGSHSRIKELRKIFNSYQGRLSPQRVQSNIIDTFKISMEEFSGLTTLRNPPARSTGEVRATATNLGPAEELFEEQDNVVERPNLADAPRKKEHEIIVLQRTVREFVHEIQSTDLATIEASLWGIFEGSQENVRIAWSKTLKLQQRKEVSKLNDPRQIALILFALGFKYELATSSGIKAENALQDRLAIALYDSGAFAETIVEDAPGPMRAGSAMTYETMSILVASLIKECRPVFPLVKASQDDQRLHRSHRGSAPSLTRLESQGKIEILMPGTVDPLLGSSPKSVVETHFLPDWMYHYPDFINRNELVIDIQKEIQQFRSSKGSEWAVNQWKTPEDFSKRYDSASPLLCAVVDSGGKKRTSAEDSLAERQMFIKFPYTGEMLWRHLIRPRSPEQAKKRLVEMSSLNTEGPLICWLTTSKQEKPCFSEFLRRHEISENFFGERAYWRGNVWETEFHIGFFELLPAGGNNTRRTQYRIKGMPSLSANPVARDIVPIAMSFRFVGDLRDRFWDCYFLYSAARQDGFQGVVNEAVESSEEEEKFHNDKQGQRKILETVYVERILSEMIHNNNEILTEFQKEFSTLQSRDLQSESFDFIYRSSTFHLKAGEILRDISQRLDSSITTIETWERREDNRGLRSRWSDKDEKRHGERLRDLTRQCRLNLQQLYILLSRLREEQTFAEERHKNLVSYMSLREARTSTRSAEDVRLFTYVTIIFLPLSFSSSLFSMQDPPSSSIISVMAQTTIVALTITFIFLSNIKSLDRNWNFWVDRLNAGARRKMQMSEHLWPIPWRNVSSELEEAAQRRLTNTDFDRRIPAESRWWYFLFWVFYALDMPRAYVLDGYDSLRQHHDMSLHLTWRILVAFFFLPLCASVLFCQILVITIGDVLKMSWIVGRREIKRLLANPKQDENPVGKVLRRNAADQQEDSSHQDQNSVVHNPTEPIADGNKSRERSRFSVMLLKIPNLLKAPPRPLQEYIRGLHQTTADLPKQQSLKVEISEFERDDLSSVHASDLPRKKEDEIEDLLKDLMTGDDPEALSEPSGPHESHAPTLTSSVQVPRQKWRFTLGKTNGSGSKV